TVYLRVCFSVRTSLSSPHLVFGGIVRLRKVILFSFFFLFSRLSAFTQVDTGAIVGTILDGQQQRLVNATIHLQQIDTGIERTTQSGNDGGFSFSPLS